MYEPRWNDIAAFPPQDHQTVWLANKHVARLGFWDPKHGEGEWVDCASAENFGPRNLGFVPTHWMHLPPLPGRDGDVG